MRIPGLGCLKGCLFTFLLLFVAGWLIWEFTPLQDWVAQGRATGRPTVGEQEFVAGSDRKHARAAGEPA